MWGLGPCAPWATGSVDSSWRTKPGGYLRKILTSRVYYVAEETPLQEAVQLSGALGGKLYLKREDFQPVKSFKLRGAYNRMAQLTPEELAAGVITSSAGNHAQGVALAARSLGCSAIICMPVTTPAIKVAAVRALGATAELVGENYNETQAYALARAEREGRVFIHPFDDPYVIAGQGTCGMELLRQTDMDSLDAVFLAVGGGGLAAGVAAYIKAVKPGIKVFGVEPAGANAMAQSLARGRRVMLSKVDTFADGVAVKQVGRETFRLCRELLDGVLIVDNAAISTAIKDVFNETRTILEPSGAVAVAGAKAYLRRPDAQELADVGGGQETTLVTTIPENPGSFLTFVETGLAGSPISVTEFKYRKSTAGTGGAHILYSIGLPPRSPECAAVIRRLEEAGCPTRDISDLEVAQVHLRHLIGGRTHAGVRTGVPERIFQVEFPELPGALHRFLQSFSPQWNISLFHYRQTGRLSGDILLGLEVPPQDEVLLQERIAGLSNHYQFTELGREGREVFDMFIS